MTARLPQRRVRLSFRALTIPKVKDSDGDQRSDEFQEEYLRIYT
jgi:hypothetical protein